jgi:hypothetical protein
MTTTTITPQKERRTLKSFFPIVEWLPKYKGSWLRFDVIAALTVWALVVPEAMAYAGIAGMPPEYGLYAAPLALIGYAIFGTSKHLNVGPSSTVAALSFGVVVGLASAGSDEFISLTIMLAIITGVLLIIGGLLRMGVLADFFSKPVLDGFIVGLAITIVVGQLDKLLGYEVEVADFVPDILGLLSEIGMTHWPTLVVGLGQRRSRSCSWPSLFRPWWVSRSWVSTSSGKSLLDYRLSVYQRESPLTRCWPCCLARLRSHWWPSPSRLRLHALTPQNSIIKSMPIKS